MKKIVAILIFLVALSPLSCSTIIATSMIKTVPDEAEIFFQGNHVGKTPWKLDNTHGLPEEVVIRFEKEGYIPLEVTLEKEMSYNYGFPAWIPYFEYLYFWAWDYSESYIFKLTPKDKTTPGEKPGPEKTPPPEQK
jgi:hypothetical protein